MPTFRDDLHLGHKVPLVESDDILKGAVTTDKISDGAVTDTKIADATITLDKLDPTFMVTERMVADGAVTTEKIADQAVTRDKIAEHAIDDVMSVFEDFKEQIESDVNAIVSQYQPIQIFGDVNNAPDEEDLTSVNIGGTDVLKLKDKSYVPSVYSGLGRVYLRKNLVSNVNILAQDMLYKDEEGSRVPNTNTVFVVQYDYDLDGETITIPTGCVLEFDGGSFDNGTITGQNTKIDAPLTKIFGEDVTLSGSWNVPVIQVQWFGVVADGTTDDSDNFQRAVSFIKDNTLSMEGIQNEIIISKSINVNIGSSQRKKTIKGNGYYGLKCSADYNVSSGALLNLSESEITLDGVVLKGISGSKTQTAISLNGRAQGISLINLNIYYFNIAIEYCNGACYNHIRDCYIYYANYGFKLAGTGWRGALDIINTKINGCSYGVYLTDYFSSIVMRGGFLEGDEYKVYCDASADAKSYMDFLNVYFADEGKEAVTLNNAKLRIASPSSAIGGSYTQAYGSDDKTTRRCTVNVISGHLELADCTVSNSVNGQKSNAVSIIMGSTAKLSTNNVRFCDDRSYGLAACDIANSANIEKIEAVPSYTLNGNITSYCNPCIPMQNTSYYAGYTKAGEMTRLETSNNRGGYCVRMAKTTTNFFGLAIPYHVPKPGRYSIRYRIKKSAGLNLCINFKDDADVSSNLDGLYYLASRGTYGYQVCPSEFKGTALVLEGSVPFETTGVRGCVLIIPQAGSENLNPTDGSYYDVEYVHVVDGENDTKICNFIDMYPHSGRGAFADAPVLTGITTDYTYFATDLNKTISWNGSKWVDDNGFTAQAPTKGSTTDRPKGKGATGGVLDPTNDIGFEYFDTTLNSPVYATAIANNGTVTWESVSPSNVPTALSELSDDSTHRLVTDTEKATWNGMIASTDVRTVVVLTQQEYDALTTKDINTEYNIIEP